MAEGKCDSAMSPEFKADKKKKGYPTPPVETGK
jgi:hypothetical protein